MAWDANDLFEQLQALRAERDRLSRLIAAMEEYAGEAPADGDDDTGVDAPARSSAAIRPGRPLSLRPDEFVGLSTSDAVKAYLGLVGKGNPQGPRDIAKAMVAGGRDGDEEKAYANVASALKRMNKGGEVRQVRRGLWGLASWYGTSAPTKKTTPRASKGEGDNGNGAAS